MAKDEMDIHLLMDGPGRDARVLGVFSTFGKAMAARGGYAGYRVEPGWLDRLEGRCFGPVWVVELDPSTGKVGRDSWDLAMRMPDEAWAYGGPDYVRGTSAVSRDDAIRLAREELNHRANRTGPYSRD